jgi:hypothetical protein
MSERSNDKQINWSRELHTKLYDDFLKEREKLNKNIRDASAKEEEIANQALKANDKLDKLLGDGEDAAAIYDIFRVRLLRTKDGKFIVFKESNEINVNARKIRLENNSQ